MLNHHHSAQTPGPECAWFADLLPLLGEGALLEPEASETRAHLATCAYCRQEYAAFQRIETNLRRHFGALPALSFSPEDLLMLSDDTTPAEPAPDSAPAPLDTKRPRRRRVVSLFSLVAAVLVVVVVVTAIVVSRNTGTAHHVASTPTPLPELPYQPLPNDSFSGVQMLSATEGWVGGTRNLSYAGLTPTGDPLILHYHGGQWRRSPTPSAAQLGVSSAVVSSFSMVSANEGWAVGTAQDIYARYGFILHYSGGRWTLYGSLMRYTTLSNVQMLSSTNGWIAGNSSDPDLVATGESHLMLHYDGKHWTLMPVPVPIVSLDMLSANDGWASGDGAILHYDGKKWAIFQEGPNVGALSMDSASDGWAAGFTQNGSGTVAFWHYDGKAWVQNPIKITNDTTNPQYVGVTALAMDSATDGLAVGVKVFQNNNNSDSSAFYLHYSQGRWTKVQGPQVKELGALSMVSADEGWAVGNSLIVSSKGVVSGTTAILHYLNGAWTQYHF